MPPRTWALATTVGTGLAMAYFARPLSTGNRVYVSVRKREELDRLLAFPNPLLANFCILTDPLSQRVSNTLQKIANGGTPQPISVVDVEVDEGDTQEIARQYMVNHLPEIVALKSGAAIARYAPTKTENLEENLAKWIDSLDT